MSTSDHLNGIANNAISNGASLVGAIVGWTFKVGPSNPVTRTDARATLAKWGRGDAVPEALAAADGIARACYEVPVSAVGADKDTLKVSKASKKKADTTASVIVYEKAEREGEAGEGWTPAGRCRVDVQQGVAVALAPDGATGTPRGLAYAAKLAAWANYLISNVGSRDLSNVLTHIVREQLHGVTVFGEKAGTYFIPSSKVADVERLAADVAAIGIYVSVIRQTDGSAAPVAAQAATESFADRIDALAKRVAECKARNVRSDGIASSLAEAVSIQSEVAMWQHVAGFQADAIATIAAELQAFFAAAASAKDAKGSTAGIPAPACDTSALRGERDADAPPPPPAPVAADDDDGAI